MHKSVEKRIRCYHQNAPKSIAEFFQFKKISTDLFHRALRGYQEAEFEVGKILFEQQEDEFAKDFLSRAAAKGHEEAERLLAIILRD